MKLRDLIHEMSMHLGEWDNATKKMAPGFKPKMAKPGTHTSRQTGKAYNKSGASTTAPTRKVPPGQLPKSR
jgi:hypothetical protein